jgi:Rrf2 family nitric oxide-sensitive transcriptional repressor
MRLTSYTDYALRLLIFLAIEPDRARTVADVAKAYGISRNHLTKVAHDLGRTGLITTVRGRHGGLRLARPAAEIRLGAVVAHTEQGMALVECFAPDGACVIQHTCELRHVLGQARAAFLATLDGHTLADVVAQPGPIARALGLAAE